jgi:para-aminobenzoate synthetase component I
MNRSDDAIELPLVQRLTPALQPEDVFRRWTDLPFCLFLDSALARNRLGRYSFLAADPYETLLLPADGSDALGELHTRLAGCAAVTRRDLPPFQGGAAGLFAYDLHRSLESIPASRCDEFSLPALAVGFYDVVLAFYLQSKEAWLISQGFPETEPARRRQRAAQRLSEFRSRLERTATRTSDARHARILAADQLSPQHVVSRRKGLTSNFSPQQYLDAVRRTVEYILAGDVFQVNLSQRLLFPAVEDAVSLYLRLRRCNPATFAAYFDLGEFQILSASPERFVQVREGRVEARPIKGTRPRLPHSEASLFAADELQQSEKDRAENVMIVDLLRNDISRVCEAATVQVTELCQLETYEYVQHLVSAVCGRLRPETTPLDLIRAAFPGGSITGAPKVRAMQIIAELEPTARGAYCGSLGYLGFDGTLDLSILIRTITAGRGWWQMPVGGGITAQSDPQREYEETWHKAIGLLRALPELP